MLKCKKLKSIHILEFLLFILLIHHVRLTKAQGTVTQETTEATGMTECSNNPDSSESVCKNSTDEDLTSGHYCIKDDKIYLSSGTVTTNDSRRGSDQSSDVSCTLAYGSAVAVEIFTAPTNPDKGYSKGTMGTTSSGIIYKCNTSKCEQLVSTYYFDDTNKKLYTCSETGSCTLLIEVSVGTYLTGLAVTTTDTTTSTTTETYTSAVSCTSTELSSCTTVDISSLTADTFYIDAATPGNIITCSASNDNCSSVAASTNEGEAYIGAGGKQVITCDSTTPSCSLSTEIASGGAAKYYIDATNTSKIITCKDDSGSKCTSGTSETGDSDGLL
ncbi:hypothetical protein BCR32DRAFT_245378 [Anaeromyces robustus]|uniref:Scaffoldin n=1 Tax=Anaeromyces robustus TaxID=1754192 RepID=A0A1Y1X4Q5_9FUNG|nr:hypothetical protein BCR32DRAFT_245378 [Anaeromyces robustus]|eukprot:ORX80800.1 hypothetical protein BCR32DRAFT_245378 [Anaeromyces robustus]